MSHRQDRERAQKGLLFRSGMITTKEELEKGQPEEASPEEAAVMIEAAMKVAGVPVTSHLKGLKIDLEE